MMPERGLRKGVAPAFPPLTPRSPLVIHPPQWATRCKVRQETVTLPGRPVPGSIPGSPTIPSNGVAIDAIPVKSTSRSADFKASTATDAAIIFSALAVEHPEITRQDPMHACARAHLHTQVAKVPGQILQQEKTAAQTLILPADSSANTAAA